MGVGIFQRESAMKNVVFAMEPDGAENVMGQKLYGGSAADARAREKL